MKRSISKIVRSCLKRDRKAEIELYDMYSRRIYNTCYRILESKEEAEEVMQDSFLKIFGMLSKFEDEPDKIEFCLKRIAINASIDIVRSRKVLFFELNEEMNILDEEPPEIEKEAEIEKIMRCIENLHPSQKLIVNLKLIENLETKEIANRLNIAESSVRSQFMRAKQNIVEQLKNKI